MGEGLKPSLLDACCCQISGVRAEIPRYPCMASTCAPVRSTPPILKIINKGVDHSLYHSFADACHPRGRQRSGFYHHQPRLAIISSTERTRGRSRSVTDPGCLSAAIHALMRGRLRPGILVGTRWEHDGVYTPRAYPGYAEHARNTRGTRKTHGSVQRHTYNVGLRRSV